MCFIITENKIAKITKKYNKYVWQLQFIDSLEYVNVFYALEEKWEYA